MNHLTNEQTGHKMAPSIAGVDRTWNAPKLRTIGAGSKTHGGVWVGNEASYPSGVGGVHGTHS